MIHVLPDVPIRVTDREREAVEALLARKKGEKK